MDMEKMAKIVEEIVEAWESGKNYTEAEDFRMLVTDDLMCVLHTPSGKTKVMTRKDAEGMWGWWTKAELRSAIRELVAI